MLREQGWLRDVMLVRLNLLKLTIVTNVRRCLYGKIKRKRLVSLVGGLAGSLKLLQNRYNFIRLKNDPFRDIWA